MRAGYDDIINLISSLSERLGVDNPILWWDECGAPRYTPFEPREASNIYADEALLLLISCQSCGKEFHVCMVHERGSEKERGEPSLERSIREKDLYYGDPPNISCCLSGPTMSSVPKRVLQYWRRARGPSPQGLSWVRDPSLEVAVTPAWATELQGASP
jgi:hypothetical protein